MNPIEQIRFDRIVKSNRKMSNLLRKLEWAGSSYAPLILGDPLIDVAGGPARFCPVCGMRKPDDPEEEAPHEEGCELYNALTEKVGKTAIMDVLRRTTE